MAKSIPAGMGPFTSMTDVKAHHQGSWFEPASMRFFDSRVSTILYGGRFFVTSEQAAYGAPRLYTVRAVMDDGGIETVGEFQQWGTRDEAHAEAIRLADITEGGGTVTLNY